MKHKIILKPDYKKIFTIDEMDYIRALKKDDEIDSTIDCLLDVLSGGYRRTYKLDKEDIFYTIFRNMLGFYNLGT